MTTPKDVRAWAQSHGFTGFNGSHSHAHVRTMFYRPAGAKRPTHKLELLKISVRFSALVKTPLRMERWIKGPFMWRTVSFGGYKNLSIEGRRLKGLRLSRAK